MAEVPVTLGVTPLPPWIPVAVVSRMTEVLWRDCGESVVLLLRGVEGDHLRRLEGLTAAMWAVVAEPVSLGELVAAAAAEAPGVSVDSVRDTVYRVVRALVDAGVATVGEPGG